ncbi:MAG: LysR substrate-binding domain-containing protein [Limimaricola soesokkakensis]|uniref:LysR substrate-binding domain-containing protein n=1 Tax=Limimaricola soesokkakensis TaxID=1343159 RepID=UPI0040583E32
MLKACRQGRGFALVRSSLVADDLATGRLLRPVEEATVSDLQHHLVIDRAAALRPEIQAFREWIIGEASGS